MSCNIHIVKCIYPEYTKSLVCNQKDVEWFNSCIKEKIINYGKDKFREELKRLTKQMYVNSKGTYNNRGINGRRNEKVVINFLREVLCDEPNWRIIQSSTYEDSKNKIDFWMYIDNNCLGIQMKIRNTRSDACYEIIRMKKNNDKFKICMGRDRSDLTRASAYMSIGFDGSVKLVPIEILENAAKKIWSNSLQIYSKNNKHNLRIWNRKNKHWMNCLRGKWTFRSRKWPDAEIRVFPCKNRSEGVYKGILYLGGISAKKWTLN